MKSRGHQLAVITSHGNVDLPDEEDYHGIPVYRLDFWEALSKRKVDLLVRAKQRVASLKRSFRPEIVHIFFTDPSVFFHLQTVDAYPAPMLLSLHIGLPQRVESEDSLLRRTFHSAGWITAASQAMLSAARQLVPEIMPYSSCVYNGLERPCVPVKPLPTGSQRILCVGRVVREKGLDLALVAFALLKHQFPVAQMVIAGDGGARKQLEDQAQRLGIRERVTFSGWVKHEDIPVFMNEATVVVMPSRWEEAFGLVALEAALMERPVIATRVGGLPEVVVDGVTGILVEKENSERLASAISRLFKNPEEAIKMGRAARARAETMFTLDHHIDAYESLYRMQVTNHFATFAGHV
jgi:glycogen(starch) synthase